MGALQYVFDAANGGASTNFILSVVAAVGGVIGMFYLLRRKVSRDERNRNIVMAMLLFFLFLIGSSTAFFSFLRMQKVGPVEVYERGMVTPYGEVDFEDIRNAEIITDKSPSLLSEATGRSTRILVIIENSGKTHALSEDDYPVQEVLGKMKQAIKAWKASEKK